ncbi:MAG: PQQ-binding-like beta-propeller repeat protein, partial [Lentisphaeria bacterium]|nr:PQQ-binding-like beta-propeller repeat protein [Lentisphaeria bacterium]
SLEDGILWTTAAGNGDDTTAVGPLPDGTGWQIRVADESHNYRAEQAVPFSFLFVPYRCRGLVAGRVLRDGTVARGVGAFDVARTAPGRYEVFIPGKTDRDGILLLNVTMLNKDGVEDNAMAWAYEEGACGGRGGFVIASYDQPDFQDQDVEFCFAFVAYGTDLSPDVQRPSRFQAAETWAESVARAAEQASTVPDGAVGPWIGPVLTAKTPPMGLSLPVQGKTHLWLMTEAHGEPKGVRALWAEPGFRMADGARRELGVEDVGYSRGAVPGAAAEVALAGGRVDRGWCVEPRSALYCAVPPGAVAFVARLGVAEGAPEGAGVRFRVSDEPHRRDSWRDDAWPVLRNRFPVEAARLQADLGTRERLDRVDLDAWREPLSRGLAHMETELGHGAQRLPAAPEGHAGALLARHGAAAQLLTRIHQARESLWQQAPRLAAFADYPKTTFTELAASLQRIADSRPTLRAEAERASKLLRTCEEQCLTMVMGRLDGQPPDAETLGRLERDVAGLAEWSGRALGWTMYGGDNRRSWICREPLALPLAPLWTYRPVLPPRPAWPLPRVDNPAVAHELRPTLTYDRAFHPVAADGRLVFGSSSEDAVICLDASTGRERWRTVVGGPVRLAPVLGGGRVYAGCDDGSVYCLDLPTGRLLWQYRADGGADRRLGGNGRVISQWAVRCGLCLDDGVLYAGAGVFPTLGTALFALDAETGAERWRRTIPWTPQGFMLLSPSRLFLPTGRTPFRSVARADGSALPSFGRSDSWGKDLPGGTLALVVNDRLITGPDEGGELHLFSTESTECLVRVRGRRIIVDGLVSYILRDDSVTAEERDPFVRRGGIQALWETPVLPAICMLKTGDHLLLGGETGSVQILEARTGTLRSTTSVGKDAVEGLMWSQGRLTASLADGTLVCLGGPGTAPPAPAPPDPEPGQVTPSAEALSRAEALVAAGGFRKGYALVAGDAELGVSLAQASDLQVLLLLRHPDEVTAWRQRLSRTGLYGDAVSVYRIEGESLPYRPYLFNLIALPAGTLGVPGGEWLRVLRPHGGYVAAREPGPFAAAARGIPGQVEEPEKGFAFAFRRGPVPGEGQWTHGYADPANTACSGDTLPFGEFEVLWFGGPGPRRMFDRHVKAAAPLFQGGTLYVTGQDYLAGMDAYNGTIFWEKEVKGSGRMAMLKDCGNMVAAEGKLFVAVNETCTVLEGKTGRKLRSHPVHAHVEGGKRWGYLAAAGDLLLGSATREETRFVPGNKADYNAVWYHFQPVTTSLALFALDRASGERRWLYTPPSGVLLNPTITVLDGRVAFVESVNPATREDADGKIPQAELFAGGPVLTALRLANGGIAWRVPITLDAFQHAIYMGGSEGVFVLTGSRHDVVDKQKLIQYQMVGIDAETGRELWRHDHTPTRGHILDGGHGEQTQHPAIVRDIVYGPGFARNLKTGSAHTGWLWQKSPQCATLSASLNCAFSRQHGNPTAANLSDGSQIRMTHVTRPGCWINTLPAGGIVIIPEASSGCTCEYSVQTSLALHPLGPRPK